MNKEFKIGDKVKIIGRWDERDLVGTITGETPKYWKLGNNLFRKDTLRLRGANVWNSSRISDITEEEIEKIKKDNEKRYLLRKIKEFDFSILDNDKIKQILTFFENAPGRKDE